MEKPECLLLSFTQAGPIGAPLFQQTEGPIDIRANEIVRTVNGAVHMALGRKVNYGARMVRQKKLSDQLTIANIALQKFVAAVGVNASEISQVSCIGELVEGDNTWRLGRKPLQHKVGADESRPAGYQNCVCHRWSSFLKPHVRGKMKNTLSCICVDLSGCVSAGSEMTQLIWFGGGPR